MYVLVEQARAFCNLPFTDDDLLLSQLIDAAELSIEHHINRPLCTLLSPYSKHLPADLETAVLSLVATWYSNRESVTYGSPNKIPYSMEYLIQPYREYRKHVLYDNPENNQE